MESIILSCLESKNDAIVDHLLQECDLIGKFLQTDKNPVLSGDSNQVDALIMQLFPIFLRAIINKESGAVIKLHDYAVSLTLLCSNSLLYLLPENVHLG